MSSNGEKDIVIVERLPLQVMNQYMALITFNRPDEMNPLDWALSRKLKPVIEDLSADKTVRVVAFIGAGKAFSAGGDMKKYLTLMHDEEGFRGFLNDIRSLFHSIEMASQPTIALVNGFCVAGGLELLLACDFAYAAASAKIGDGHVNFGQIGGGGSQVRLPRRILPTRAREMLFTGKLLNAQEALEWGVVNQVVPDGKLIETALEFANTIAQKSWLGIRIIKQIVNQGLNLDEEAAAYLEIQMVHHYCLTSYDSHEGLVAFSEKRQPKFEGR